MSEVKHSIGEIRAAAAQGEGFCLVCGKRQDFPDFGESTQTVAQCDGCWEFGVIAAEEVLENLAIVDLDGEEGGEGL